MSPPHNVFHRADSLTFGRPVCRFGSAQPRDVDAGVPPPRLLARSGATSPRDWVSAPLAVGRPPFLHVVGHFWCMDPRVLGHFLAATLLLTTSVVLEVSWHLCSVGAEHCWFAGLSPEPFCGPCCCICCPRHRLFFVVGSRLACESEILLALLIRLQTLRMRVSG